MVTTKGKKVGTKTVSLPEGNTVDIKDRCNYQLAGKKRKLATAKYLQRGRQVLSSQLKGKNKFWAINPDAPSVRYTSIIGIN